MYDHYIGLDWAQDIMALARLTKKAKKIHDFERKADIRELKDYLSSLRGTIQLTFEESTSSQWLYTELRDVVDDLIVCDPRRNSLMREGPKTDRIDAIKLLRLMRADMLKPVYHSGDEFIYIRKLVSGYQDLIKAMVRTKNQKTAILRASGKRKEDNEVGDSSSKFVLDIYNECIASQTLQKKRYLEKFNEISKKHKVVRCLKTIPGISTINAVKLAAIVVDAKRYPTAGHFLSYCGLIKYDLQSGGKSYGRRKTNYNRTLKNVFDTAAVVAMSSKNNSEMKQSYNYYLDVKNLPAHSARRALSRYIARCAYGVMKSNSKYSPARRSEGIV